MLRGGASLCRITGRGGVVLWGGGKKLMRGGVFEGERVLCYP